MPCSHDKAGLPIVTTWGDAIAPSTVVLIGPDTTERQWLGEWARALDPSIEIVHFDSLAAVESRREEMYRAILVVLHLRDDLQRPKHEVRKLRSFLRDNIPLLALIPPSQSKWIRECLVAGADDFWLLPLTKESFLPRLQVLLEWSATAGAPESTLPEESSPGVRFRHRLAHWMRRLFGTGPAVGVDEMRKPSPLLGGKWRTERHLGGGSYAEVWLVTHDQTGELAVAKVPHSREMNRRFMHEAAILKRFEGHPHAVRMKEIIQEEGRAVLIQEYVEGKTLQERLDESMESAEKEAMFLQLLDVTAYGHDRNIMHRDIKPENIIVQASGDIKLLDFGTGKDLVKKHVSGTIIGTRPYMSPEQINGESCLSSDVWALGVILYALSTGYLPFFDQNEKHLMDEILECRPENPSSLEPSVCEGLERIILRCLEKKPENRYANAGQLLEDVRKTFPDFGRGGVIPD